MSIDDAEDGIGLDAAEDAEDRAAAEEALVEYRREGGVEASAVFETLPPMTTEPRVPGDGPRSSR